MGTHLLNLQNDNYIGQAVLINQYFVYVSKWNKHHVLKYIGYLIYKKIYPLLQSRAKQLNKYRQSFFDEIALWHVIRNNKS